MTKVTMIFEEEKQEALSQAYTKFENEKQEALSQAYTEIDRKRLFHRRNHFTGKRLFTNRYRKLTKRV